MDILYTPFILIWHHKIGYHKVIFICHARRSCVVYSSTVVVHKTFSRLSARTCLSQWRFLVSTLWVAPSHTSHMDFRNQNTAAPVLRPTRTQINPSAHLTINTKPCMRGRHKTHHHHFLTCLDHYFIKGNLLRHGGKLLDMYALTSVSSHAFAAHGHHSPLVFSAS